jgi:hypothetical protein
MPLDPADKRLLLSLLSEIRPRNNFTPLLHVATVSLSNCITWKTIFCCTSYLGRLLCITVRPLKAICSSRLQLTLKPLNYIYVTCICLFCPVVSFHRNGQRSETPGDYIRIISLYCIHHMNPVRFLNDSDPLRCSSRLRGNVASAKVPAFLRGYNTRKANVPS